MKSKALCKGSNDTVIIVTAGSVVLALAFGVRAVFGGVIQPLSDDLFAGRIQIFSLSIAIQNLVWGLAQPGFGIIADKFGDRRALWLGFFLYVVGMVVCVTGTSPLAQHLGAGVLVGMGIWNRSCGGWSGSAAGKTWFLPGGYLGDGVCRAGFAAFDRIVADRIF
jgi:MFS family permease